MSHTILDVARIMHDDFNIPGNPLIDLRIYSETLADRMESYYLDAYNNAPDGAPTPYDVLATQAFSVMMGVEPMPRTKGDIVREWIKELQNNFPRAYMESYTRDEAKTMLNLLLKEHHDNIRLQLAPGFSCTVFDLAYGWNASHPDEPPIEFSGYGNYMP